MIAIDCIGEAVRCLNRVLIGPSDDGVQRDPRGRTEYGLACFWIGLASLKTGHLADAEKSLDEAMKASFYPIKIRDSYFGTGVIIDGKDVGELGMRGSEVELVREARALCATTPRTY